MAPAPRLMSVDDYFQTPETVLPAELIFGAYRVAEAPTVRHQSAVRDIAFALMTHLRENPVGELWLSPIDVVLDGRRDLVVQPDLVFVASANLDIVKDRIFGAPDLVVEVLSPHPRIGRLDERLEWFARYGVRECWLLHQDERRLEVVTFARRAIDARHSSAANEPIASGVLPDFHQSLATMLRADAIP